MAKRAAIMERSPSRKTNPDRLRSFDPVWGHTGPTLRAVMEFMADEEGKLALLERRSAESYPRNEREQEATDYFIETRTKAERLIKRLRGYGVPVGWGDP